MKDAAHTYIVTADVIRLQEIMTEFFENPVNRKLFTTYYQSWDAYAAGELLFDFARDYAEERTHESGADVAWIGEDDAA